MIDQFRPTTEREIHLPDWIAGATGTREFDPAPASTNTIIRRYFRTPVEFGIRIVMDAHPLQEEKAGAKQFSGRRDTSPAQFETLNQQLSQSMV